MRKARDIEPATVRYRGVLVTTWQGSDGLWMVHTEDMTGRAVVEREGQMPKGADRLDAIQCAKDWIDSILGKEKP